MPKITIKYELVQSPQVIDLLDYGYNKKWTELTEKEQTEVSDDLIEQLISENPIRVHIEDKIC